MEQLSIWEIQILVLLQTIFLKYFKFDLLAGSQSQIINSKVIINSDTIAFNSPNGPLYSYMHLLQLAPNGKIYIVASYNENFLSCINFPNALVSCQSTIDGYNLFNLILESLIVNLQFIFAFLLFL